MASDLQDDRAKNQLTDSSDADLGTILIANSVNEGRVDMLSGRPGLRNQGEDKGPAEKDPQRRDKHDAAAAQNASYLTGAVDGATTCQRFSNVFAAKFLSAAHV
jgi:hypothetical protein